MVDTDSVGAAVGATVVGEAVVGDRVLTVGAFDRSVDGCADGCIVG